MFKKENHNKSSKSIQNITIKFSKSSNNLFTQPYNLFIQNYKFYLRNNIICLHNNIICSHNNIICSHNNIICSHNNIIYSHNNTIYSHNNIIYSHNNIISCVVTSVIITPTCLLNKWKYWAGVVGFANWMLTLSLSATISLLSVTCVINNRCIEKMQLATIHNKANTNETEHNSII